MLHQLAPPNCCLNPLTILWCFVWLLPRMKTAWCCTSDSTNCRCRQQRSSSKPIGLWSGRLDVSMAANKFRFMPNGNKRLLHIVVLNSFESTHRPTESCRILCCLNYHNYISRPSTKTRLSALLSAQSTHQSTAEQSNIPRRTPL